jgi:hypothetical protein
MAQAGIAGDGRGGDDAARASDAGALSPDSRQARSPSASASFVTLLDAGVKPGSAFMGGEQVRVTPGWRFLGRPGGRASSAWIFASKSPCL